MQPLGGMRAVRRGRALQIIQTTGEEVRPSPPLRPRARATGANVIPFASTLPHLSPRTPSVSEATQGIVGVARSRQ